MFLDTEQLGRAVIKQALADAGVGMETGERASVSGIERDRARSFLTAAGGEWKEARHFWASMADLCPEKLRTGTMKLLGIEPPAVPALAVQARPSNDAPLQLFYPVPKPEKPRRPTKRETLRQSRATRPREVPSRRQQVVAMLMRPEGVSLDEIVERFGWKRETARNCVSSDVRSYGVRGIICRDGRYRAFTLP